jgi:tRNA(Ile2) C34 agmatinyltransferase TiaS
MFGLFSNPNCPKCGRETEETGYAAPYPQYRCRSCITRNKENKNLQMQIDELRQQLDNKYEQR